MKKNILFLFGLVLFLAVLVFSLDKIFAALPGDEGLTLSPPLREVTVAPGQTNTQTIKITNPTAKLVELYPKVMDFNSKGETGEPGFSEPGENSGKYSLASWIKISQSKIALTPEQIVEYTYTINVPSDAEPGGHYGVIFFATEPPEISDSSSNVALSSMVGGLVLVRVPGDIVEGARIEELKSDKFVYLFNKVALITRINNLCNVHFKPTGTINIKNVFGHTTDTLTFNEQNGNVLPESIRKFDNQWDSKKILVGPYTATANLVYGESKQALTDSTTFWVIPWWLLVVVAVIIVSLSVYLIIRKKKKKSGARF